MTQEIVPILEHIGNIGSMIVLTAMAVIVGYRFLNDVRKNQFYNWIRFCIFGVFFGFSLMSIFEFLFETFPPISEMPSAELILGKDEDYFGLYNISLSIMITFALSMIAYTNGWKTIYYLPIFIIIGMYILYLYSGFYGFLMPYVYGSAVFAIIFLYITGIRLKDNGSLGLAIFFTLAFVSLLSTGLIDQIFVLVYLGLGVIISLGLFKPFKESEEY
ncbi:MAG: membrane protein of unknown function [Promethearchaeota archaeon]|nr:MAG: membrane protein of unknown function [Candidatus Lokiarchaeota archaeon]